MLQMSMIVAADVPVTLVNEFDFDILIVAAENRRRGPNSTHGTPSPAQRAVGSGSFEFLDQYRIALVVGSINEVTNG